MAYKIYSRKDIEIILDTIDHKIRFMEKFNMIKDARYKKLIELQKSLGDDYELMSSYKGELIDYWKNDS